MPQFLERRYSAACRTWLAVASLLAYVFTKVAVSIFAATVIFRVILELKHEWIGAMILMAATAAYTAVGGLAAVVYTEALQSVVLVVGAGFLFLIGMVQVGGFQGLADKLPEGHFHMFRSAHDHEFPWTGILLGFPVISFWYWCTDQVIVQRVLGAKSIKAAREGTILAGYLKLLPLFLLVFPGMISRALYPDEVQQDSNKAYPLLVVRLLPKGMVGVLVAAMLSALMSSFASLFNSCGTIFTMDFYAKLIRPNASQRELLLSGRAATLVMLFLGMLWIYIIPYLNPQLYIYLQSVQGYFAPPITAVFLVGILWRGANNIGAFACLVLGTMVGGLRLLMEILHGVREKHGNDEEEELHGGDTFTASSWFFKVFVESNFLHFTFGLFVFCVSVLIVGSLVSNWWKRRQRRHLQLFISAAQEEEAEALQQLQQQEDEEERRRAAEIDKLVLRMEDTFLSRFYRKSIPHEGDQETRAGGKKQRRMYAPVLSLKGQGVKDEEDGIEMQSLETKQEEKEDEDCLHEVTLEDEEQEEEEEEGEEESTVTEIATSSPDQLQEQDRRCYVTHAISVALLVSTVFAVEIAFR
ncbi:Sodium transporter, variant 2 [Balamuthia mandrillaris]